jgi:MFS family permease
MLNNLIVKSTSPLKVFNRSVWLYLSSVFFFGFITTPAWMLFNFYILSRGYGKDFLGLVNAMPNLAVLLLGIPIGMLSDRISRRNASLLGVTAFSLAAIMQVSVQSSSLILFSGLLIGIGNGVFAINQAPFLMKLTTNENHSKLFGLTYASTSFSSAVGSIVAGGLPVLFSRLLRLPLESMEVYRSILLASSIIGLLVILPIFLIEKDKPEQKHTLISNPFKLLLSRKTGILLLPNLLIGLGAGFFIPFTNVFFVEKFSISSLTLGNIFFIQQLCGGIGSLFAPLIAHKFGSKARVMYLSIFAGLIFLMIMGFSPVLWLSVLGFLLRYSFMFIYSPLYPSFVMEQIEPNERGTVTSAMEICFRVGWAVSPYFAGILMQNYSFPPIFLCAGIFYACTSLVVWFFFRQIEGQKKQALEIVET